MTNKHSDVLTLEELKLKLNEALERERHAFQVIAEKDAEITQLHQMVASYAAKDQLTGLYNRKYVVRYMQEEVERSIRSDQPFSILLVDIDDFKHVNDTFGYLLGDKIIKQLALDLKRSVRRQDIVARWDGDRFLVMLPETDIEGGMIVGEKIRSYIQAKTYQIDEVDFELTVTAGIAAYEQGTVLDLIRAADDALYYAKQSGKNQIKVSRHI